MQRLLAQAAIKALGGSTAAQGALLHGSQRSCLHSVLSRQLSQARLVTEGSLGQQSQHARVAVIAQSASVSQVVSPIRALGMGAKELAEADTVDAIEVELASLAEGEAEAPGSGTARPSAALGRALGVGSRGGSCGPQAVRSPRGLSRRAASRSMRRS